MRVQTACLHHMCVVIFASENHLHGNVAPNTLKESPIAGVGLLRLVPYGRKGINDLTSAVEKTPKLWEKVLPKLDEQLKAHYMASRGA